jgi:hypothetical protein
MLTCNQEIIMKSLLNMNFGVYVNRISVSALVCVRNKITPPPDVASRIRNYFSRSLLIFYCSVGTTHR